MKQNFWCATPSLRICPGQRWRGLLWVAAVGCVVGVATSTWALNVHSIELGRYATASEAEAARSAAAESASPVFIRQESTATGVSHVVLAGHFPYYAEAWVGMKKLQEAGQYPQCAVVTWEWDGRELVPSTLPIALPFNTTGLDPATASDPEGHWKAAGVAGLPEPEASVLAKAPSEMTREELLAVGLGASDKALAVPALERFVASYPGASETNRVRLRLGRLTGCNGTDDAYALLDQIRASGTDPEKALSRLVEAYMLSCRKKRAESFAAFQALANDSTLPASLRLEAMRRAARHAHALRDYPTAWLALEQVERMAPDAATAANARMERAACAFELVGRAKGTWEETRQLCQSVEEIAGAPPEPCATARLMFTESYFNDGNYGRAAEEADRLVTDFATINRERVSALYWKARSLEELHQIDAALAVYQQIDADAITPDQLFPALNAKAKGLHHQARLYRQQGNDAAALAAEQKLAQLYPTSDEAKLLSPPQP